MNPVNPAQLPDKVKIADVRVSSNEAFKLSLQLYGSASNISGCEFVLGHVFGLKL
jgi:hypothetical protein